MRQLLLDKTNYVFATMRSVPTDVTAPIKNLQARYQNEEDDRLQLVKLDTTDEASIKAAVAEVAKYKPDGIDYLINNAGALQSLSTGPWEIIVHRSSSTSGSPPFCTSRNHEMDLAKVTPMTLGMEFQLHVELIVVFGKGHTSLGMEYQSYPG